MRCAKCTLTCDRYKVYEYSRKKEYDRRTEIFKAKVIADAAQYSRAKSRKVC